MQRAKLQQATVTQIPEQVRLVLPGHGTGLDDQAINDEIYTREDSLIRLVLSVLANTVGGALLLWGMFTLPQLVGNLLS